MNPVFVGAQGAAPAADCPIPGCGRAGGGPAGGGGLFTPKFLFDPLPSTAGTAGIAGPIPIISMTILSTITDGNTLLSDQIFTTLSTDCCFS